MNVIARIFAKSPPAIAIALGGIGMLFKMPNAGLIFFSGVALQLAWLGIMKA